jgi:hypothetical protein
MTIGERIKAELTSRGKNAKWLSEQIPCERTNAYKILKRKDIDCALLQRISIILHHDFFKELSEETFGVSKTEEETQKEVEEK